VCEDVQGPSNLLQGVISSTAEVASSANTDRQLAESDAESEATGTNTKDHEHKHKHAHTVEVRKHPASHEADGKPEGVIGPDGNQNDFGVNGSIGVISKTAHTSDDANAPSTTTSTVHQVFAASPKGDHDRVERVRCPRCPRRCRDLSICSALL